MYEENFYAEKGLREGKKKKSGVLKKDFNHYQQR